MGTSSAGSSYDSNKSSGFAGDDDDSEDEVVVERVLDMEVLLCIMPGALAYISSLGAPNGLLLFCLLDS